VVGYYHFNFFIINFVFLKSPLTWPFEKLIMCDAIVVQGDLFSLKPNPKIKFNNFLHLNPSTLM